VKVPRDAPWSPWRRAAAAAAVLAAVACVWAARSLSGAGADPDEVWKDAQDAFKAGRYDRAEAGLARLGRLRTPTPLDWVLKAQLAMLRGRDDEAIDDLAKVPDGHPMGAQARLLAGQVELRRKRVRKAEALLLHATRIDPDLVQAHKELVFIYGMQLRRPELRKQFQELSRLTPLTYDNVWHWCLTRNTVWEPKEIIADLRRFVDADPDDRESRIALADNLRRVGRFSEVESVLAPLGPNDPDARAVRARVALDRGDDQAAEALLAEGPADHPELARMRGRLALARRDGPAAVKHFRAAYALDPDDRDMVFGLGQALIMVGDTAAAAPYVEKSHAFDALGTLMQRASTPEGRRDPNLVRALGAACERVQRLPEALAWYRLAIKSDPFDSEAQKAVYRLTHADAVPIARDGPGR
jgi:tetratricopeptide (TPR) repeat protein